MLCLGGGELGGSIDRAHSFAILDRFLEAGGNFLDTAWVYGAEGASERTIGAWMTSRGARERVVLATKGGHPAPDGHIRLAPDELREDIAESLRRLQTEVIDLYWLHRDDPNRPVGEIMATLGELRDAGQARYFGASNWLPARIHAANAFARANDLPAFIADQTLWNAACLCGLPYGDPTVGYMSQERRAFHETSGMAMTPFQPQAYGYFQRLEAGTLEEMNRGFRGFYDESGTRARFAVMREIERETGLSISQIVLAYLTSQPIPTAPILGFKRLEQVEDSLRAADVRLTADHVARIEGAAPNPCSHFN